MDVKVEELPKVTATPTYYIKVECPYCHKQCDCSDDYEIVDAMFENTTAACTNMGIEYTCPHCEQDFIVDELEY